MNEFKILSVEKEPIVIVPALPAGMNMHKLPGSQAISAKGSFGQMLFQHFKGDGFDIWFSNYNMRANTKLIGRADDAVLELHTHYSKVFITTWKGIRRQTLYDRQYQLTFSPSTDTTAEFEKGKECVTFDIHFHKAILHPYAEFCPRLGRFLESVEAGQAASLLNVVRFMPVGMEEAIRSVLQYSMHEGLTASFFRSKVNEILVYLVEHINLLDKAPVFPDADIRKAVEAKKILEADLQQFYKVEDVARLVMLPEHKLQLAFKHLYGVTVGKFYHDLRMKTALEKMLAGVDTQATIGFDIGHKDVGNFSTAFKKYFGYKPGDIKKKKK